MGPTKKPPGLAAGGFVSVETGRLEADRIFGSSDQSVWSDQYLRMSGAGAAAATGVGEYSGTITRNQPSVE